MQPTPAVDLTRMTHYRGGTYSHTVDTIVFTDGSSARTDLIRLNPNVEAYSLDFTGIAPVRPSRYAADSWEAVPHLHVRAHEAEIDWILRNSYPTLATTTLSERLRAAGYELGSRNITDHEAIAGTQAAIWYLTNGLELDDRPLDLPARAESHSGGVTVEFDGNRQLGGYSAEVSTKAGAVITLQKSVDGVSWDDVAASTVTVPVGGGPVSKSLGVGSTLSDSRDGRRGDGHRHYRLVIDGAASINDLRFRLEGSRRYRNAEFIVYLYDYLLAGARAAREATVSPALDSGDATVCGGLVGPFRLAITDAATVTSTGGHLLVVGDTESTGDLVNPREEFYVRIAPGSDSGTTLSVKVPGKADGFGGRVLTGVVRDELDGRYTPLALAVPSQLVVEFDIDWSAM